MKTPLPAILALGVMCAAEETAGAAVAERYTRPSDAELRRRLTPLQYAVTQRAATERPHDNAYVGSQYRTGIYYVDPGDRPVIEEAWRAEQARHAQPLAVEKLPLVNFYAAEDYHQDYLEKNPRGYCHLPAALFKLAREAKPQNR